MGEREIVIRNLNWQDKEDLAKLIDEIASTEDFENIKKLIVFNSLKAKDSTLTEEEASKAMVSAASGIFNILREKCLPKLKLWLLSLTGLSEEEFNKTMPFDADVKILNQVLSQESFSGFFSGASLLFNRIKESVVQYIKKLQK